MNSLWFALAVGFKCKLFEFNCGYCLYSAFSISNVNSDFSTEKRDCKEKYGNVKDVLLGKKRYLENYWIHHSKMVIIYSQKRKKKESPPQLVGCRGI